MRKIAFIGTHGVGKTTLAHELVSKLKRKGVDADFLGEIARKCPFPINEQASKKTQIWIILSQIIGEIEEEGKSEFLVCDRSVLDGYCYYADKFGISGVIEPIVAEHMKTYDCLVKLPIRQGFLKKDKIRSVDSGFQKRIEVMMNKLLKRLEIKYINFKDSSMSDDKIISEVIKRID